MGYILPVLTRNPCEQDQVGSSVQAELDLSIQKYLHGLNCAWEREWNMSNGSFCQILTLFPGWTGRLAKVLWDPPPQVDTAECEPMKQHVGPRIK